MKIKLILLLTLVSAYQNSLHASARISKKPSGLAACNSIPSVRRESNGKFYDHELEITTEQYYQRCKIVEISYKDGSHFVGEEPVSSDEYYAAQRWFTERSLEYRIAQVELIDSLPEGPEKELLKADNAILNMLARFDY